MSAPQLTDANTSSEWFRTVGDAESPAARDPRSRDARRKRFGRLVTCTMVGLLGFTLVGLASFAWRQHEQRSQLAAPVAAAFTEVAPEPATPAAAPPSAVAPAPAAAVAPAPAAAVAPAPAAAVAPEAPKAVAASKARTALGAKPARKRSAFLGNLKQPAKLTR